MGRADPGLAYGWLAARSLARALPAPVEDHGGWRVDSGQPSELKRYLFVEPVEGLRILGAAIDEPYVMLKLLRPADELMRLLPSRWHLSGLGWMMTRDGALPHGPELPPGYALDVDRLENIFVATIRDATGILAARGHAVEAGGVFVYDRIVTEEAHRRRGLGRLIMLALGRCRRSASAPELLVATESGRALYRTIGWRDLSSLATAAIPPLP